MKRYLFVITLLSLFSTHVWAVEPAAIEEPELVSASVNINDMASIKRGAKFFATNCMSCHTLIYLRYDKVANEAGITLDKMPINVTNWPNGVKPPDLSLEIGVRGADWVYTYLHSFYQDPVRPTGFNNLLVHNTAMPDIVAPYQGSQVLVPNPMHDWTGTVQWYDEVNLTKQGSMTPEQFDGTVADLVNFLSYAEEPFRAQQERLGVWVIGFLFILLILTYFLKKEYWKDVKKNRE